MTERTIYLGLGGNQGDVLQSFKQALELLHKHGLHLQVASSIIQTKPWGPIAQPDFYNLVVAMSATSRPIEILNTLQDVEKALGRDRKKEERWGPRTLDIDYLYDKAYPTWNTPELTLPHPRIAERLFVLVPFAEIAPNLTLPSIKGTVSALRDALLSTGAPL